MPGRSGAPKKWAVIYSDMYSLWIETLSTDQQEALLAAVDVLEDRGPTLGRPLVDTLQGSTHGNMKELRPPSEGDTALRVLFAFNTKREAILLVGGDKAGNWIDWYTEHILLADELFRQHQDKLNTQTDKKQKKRKTRIRRRK
jgi:hypothetical protein